MKLIFLIILLCGITTTPAHTVKSINTKKASDCNMQVTTVKADITNLDMLPSGLLFQF